MSENTIHYPHMEPVKTAAQMFGLSPYFIRNLCRTGAVRYVQVSPHKWLVNVGSLAQYLDAGQAVPDTLHSVQGIRRIEG